MFEKLKTFIKNVNISELRYYQPGSTMARRITGKEIIEKVDPIFNRNRIIPDSAFLYTPPNFRTQAFLKKWGSVLAKKKVNDRWPADIIDEASQFVSARIILTQLEKEYRLIRGQEAYLHKDALVWSMGYSRNDAGGRNPAAEGFINQVMLGAANMRSRFDNDAERFIDKDISESFIKKHAEVQDGIVTPYNKATVVLYMYTPWIGERDQLCGGIKYTAPFGNFYFWRLWRIFFGGE